MSAIGGIVSLNQDRIPSEVAMQFAQVMEVQKHRGPNARGFCGFGFNKETMLSQNTLESNFDFPLKGIIGHNLLQVNASKDAVQPFCNYDGTIGIAYDGQIVNTKEIKD